MLLVRAVTLDGQSDGIRFYTSPDWDKLGDVSVWSKAATQAMYSLSVGYGGHIVLASYNKFNNSIFRDAIILTLADTFTSIFGGFIVFAFIGHAAKILNKPVESIVGSGLELLFVSYVKGISQLPGAAVWSFLFFLVVVTLGLDSVFVHTWTVYTGIHDVFPTMSRKWGQVLLLTICVVSFLLGLPLVTRGGIHLFVMLDDYTATFALTVFLLIESSSVCWIYGLTNFVEDIEMMIGKRSKVFQWYLKITWYITSPIFCMVSFIHIFILLDLT